MSLARAKTWIAGEVLTASDLNSEFNNIINNPGSLITGSTLAGGLTFGGTVAFGSTNPIAANGEALGICEGRLTVTTGTPVTTGDVTGAGTLYWTPYKGNRIALFDGSSTWNILTFAEVSLALTLTSGKPYDLFAYNSSGSVALESLVWTDDTNRATALTTQNGVLVKTGATTRRYLGTIYSSGANTTEDSFAKRYVWNYYNRVVRPMRAAAETADTWGYNTATVRQANANTANQLNFVIGYNEDAVQAEAFGDTTHTGANGSQIGIGLDSTTAFATGFRAFFGSGGANITYSGGGFWKGFPGVGRHYLSWLEQGDGVGSTFFGDGGAPTVIQLGIHGSMMG